MSIKPNPKSARNYVLLSAIAAAFVAVFVFFGTGGVLQAEGAFSRAAISFGITFIVSLVGISTLALTVKENEGDPNQPRLK